MPVRTPRLWSESLLTSGTESKPTTEAKPQDPVPRHMYDSYSQVVFPFSSSPELLEQYVNAWGGIRTGKLMEHLDSLAGSIAYKHMLGPTVETLGKINERGYYIVTASVDRLDMLSSLHPVRDIRLGGHVIYTGRSSMEVAVTMEALEGPGKERTVMLGRFSMVCRDAQTHKAHPVNPLIADTPEEKRLLAIGESLKARKQLEAQHSLSRVPPSIEEAQELHGVYLSGLNRTEDHSQYEQVYMHTTKLEKTMLMFPQERNVHQKVFGGYLMRLAYELGFANATLFSRRKHLRFLSLDGIAFERPVSIGSILKLKSIVTHSSSKEYPAVVHVFVQANVVDPLTGAEQKTNDFRFTWCDDGGEPLQRVVVPQTYAESMRWIEGRRALEMGERIRGLRKLELS
ncbi:Thioesterase/thiol ester dehydrase-isomerase [Schizopora paradoxa]|uniref:Thioesterase/thiol ester dehydrase-isomerase n=1 Tax=Schizopora paradoxa TaxID=27342 RepID=A0A0H2RI75_9AGAM|nr:Thioesterase/thiol ester dehydrase-isomerase [Schizopora paradoxa]